MLSRRELITAGVIGGAAPAVAAGAPVEQQAPDRDGQREIARRIGEVQDVLKTEFQTSSLSYGFVAKLRADMEQFIRSNTKFPDVIEVGIAVFMDVYDWHIKNRQQLTTLVLRPQQDRAYVGVPFDRG
jgi:hypothetical protein